MPSELLAILRDYAILFPTIISQEANAMLTMLLSMLSDEEDRKALYDLYMQYQDAMLRVARRYFPSDPASADDAVQNAWLRAIDNFSKISEIPRKKRGAYLVIIVKNEALTLMRKYGKELPLDESLTENGTEDDDSASIVDVIRSMSETYRAVLEMRLVEERSTREIAAALGLSESAVDTRISRGRAMLAEKLRKEGYTV